MYVNVSLSSTINFHRLFLLFQFPFPLSLFPYFKSFVPDLSGIVKQKSCQEGTEQCDFFFFNFIIQCWQLEISHLK